MTKKWLDQLRGQAALALVLVVLTIVAGAVLAHATGKDIAYPSNAEVAVIETDVLGAVEINTARLNGSTTTQPAPVPSTDPAVVTTDPPGVVATSPPTTVPSSTGATVAPTDVLPGEVALSVGHVEMGTASLALLPYDVEANISEWDIVFLESRSGIRGLALPAEKRIEIYVRDTDTAESLVRVIAHEVGHAVDISLNSAADRDAWAAARGLDSSVPWWPDGVSFDFDTGAGDFAEAFATVMSGSDSKSQVGGVLTPEQADLVVRLSTP